MGVTRILFVLWHKTKIPLPRWNHGNYPVIPIYGFTSLANIGGNLFTRNTKNLNHVHKESNNLLSVIIILGSSVHGGWTVFNDG